MKECDHYGTLSVPVLIIMHSVHSDGRLAKTGVNGFNPPFHLATMSSANFAWLKVSTEKQVEARKIR